MEKNIMARHYESQFDNLKLENVRNREIVKAAFKNMQDNYDKLKEDNALLLDAIENLSHWLNRAANSLEAFSNEKGGINALTPKLKWYAEKIEEAIQKTQPK